MWPFDYFKKKPSIATTAPPGLQPPHLHAAHAHHAHAHPAHVTPAAVTPKTHGPLRKYLTDPVPAKKPSKDVDEDLLPTVVGGFLVGELLGSLTAPSIEPADSGPIEITNTTPESFEGFGGGTSGGGGASGSWDAPSSDSSSSSGSDSSSDSTSSDSSSSDSSSAGDAGF